MSLSSAQLASQYQRAKRDWPFIDEVNAGADLPPYLLYAVGSRETNLRHIVGDYGHGHGVWQLDDRTPGRGPAIARIDGGDVRYAAEYAADMLAALHRRFGTWLGACNAYNSGRPETERTTGKDYGPDVLERRGVLEEMFGPPRPRQKEREDMPQIDVKAGDVGEIQYEALPGVLRLWSGRVGQHVDGQFAKAEGCNLRLEAWNGGDDPWFQWEGWADWSIDGQQWELPNPPVAGGVNVSAIGPNGVSVFIDYAD